MIRFVFLIFFGFFIYSCFFPDDSLDYDLQNQRFDYSSLISFKSSIITHFNNDTNRFDIKKLDNLETSKSITIDLNLFKENKNHEQLIEKYPDKVYKFILYIKDNNDSEKIVFESTQAYLRYLTEDKMLR